MSFHLKIENNREYEEKYRQYVSGLGLPDGEIYPLIGIVHAIMSYFVDQAFGVQTDQITLRSIGDGFNISPDHAMIESHPENQAANVQNHGVEGESNPKGPIEP